MSAINDHWSKTSFELFSKCPRAWAIAYGRRNSSPKLLPTKGSASHLRSNLMVRAGRRTFIEELGDLFNNKKWSLNYLKRRVKAHLDDQVWTHRLQTDSIVIEGLSTQISHRLIRLRQTDLLKPIWTRQPRRWAYFERFTSTQIGNLALFATPDIVVHHQHKWTLIRLRFQSGPSLPSRELEDMLMVHWAMHKSGLPDRYEDYRIRTLTWRGGQWVQENVEVDAQRVHLAWMMLQHDVQEMTWMKRCISADPTLESLPLARTENDCRGCNYKPTCPASNGLEQAKYGQRIKQGFHQS